MDGLGERVPDGWGNEILLPWEGEGKLGVVVCRENGFVMGMTEGMEEPPLKEKGCLSNTVGAVGWLANDTFGDIAEGKETPTDVAEIKLEEEVAPAVEDDSWEAVAASLRDSM